MSTNDSGISRRHFLKLGAAAAGGLAFSGVKLPIGAFDAQVRTDLQGQIVVSLLGGSPPPQAVFDAMSKAYAAFRPNVKLIWEYPGLGSDTYPTWLGTQLAAKPIRPDVVSGSMFPTYQGYVDFDQDRATTNPFTNQEWDKDLDWDFYVFRNTLGKRIMLPDRAVHIFFFYNKDMFAKAGVQPPTTWDEFVDVCAKLKAALPDVAPVVANYIWQVPQWLIETHFDQMNIDWVNTVRAQDGDWNFDPTLDGAFKYDPTDANIHNKYTFSNQRFYAAVRDGKLRFDTPQVAEILRQQSRIFPKYATSDFFTIADPYPRFISQQAAIMYDGTWSLSTLSNDLKNLTPDRLTQIQKSLGATDFTLKQFAWGNFEMPSLTGPLVKTASKSIEASTGEYLSIIDKNVTQTALSLDFVQFWLSAPGQQPWVDALAAANQGFTGPLKVYGVKEPADVAALWKELKFLGNAEVTQNQFYLAITGGDLQTSAHAIWRAGLEGKTSPQDTAAALQKLIQDNFPAILKAAGLTNDDLNNPARQPGT